MRVLAVVIAALAFVPAASASTTLTGGVQNTVVPSAIITQAGTELVSWESPSGTISISRSNTAGKTIVTGDPIPGRTQMIQQPSGAIQLYFPNAAGVGRMTSTDDGATWTGPIQTQSHTVGPVEGAAVAPDGTPYFSQDGTGFVNVFLDGMSFKNPINHGGVFGQNFGLGNPFPQIAIQEYQVQTQNFGAETGQAGSAVISAITKTGGNEFHGSVFLEYQPNSFITQPYFDKLNHVPKPDYNRKQYGGEFGGPIIPGKLHFYVAAELTNQFRPGSTGTVNPALFPANLVAQTNIAHSMDFKQGLYFGKLTSYMTDADTLNLIGYLREEDNLSDIDSNATSSHARRIRTTQDRWQVQWRHNAGGFVNQLNVSYDKATQDTPSLSPGPELVLLNSANPDFSNGIESGGHFFQQGDTQKSWTFKDDAILRMGGHSLKLGGQFGFLDLSRSVNNSYNGRYYFANPGPVANFDFNNAQPIQTRIDIAPTPTLSAQDTQIGVYLQDEWKANDHWTVNYGLRWDYESNANNNNYVTPPAIAAALRAYPGWPARGINPEDYISNGSNRQPFYGAFQPRVGLAYDVHGDRDLVLFAGAGRYYDRQLFIQGVIEALTNSTRILPMFFCPGGGAAQGTGTGADAANCMQWSESFRDPATLRALAAQQAGSGGGDVWVLNNKTKMPYSDQFSLGLRKRFGDIQTSVTLSHIRTHNIQMFVRSNFYSNGWFTTVLTPTGCVNGGDQWIIDLTPNGPFPNCAATNAQLTGFNGKLNRGESDGEAHYNALYFSAEKPVTSESKWGFTTALTLQQARSNVAQELNSDEFYNGPNLGTFGWNNVNGVPKWSLVSSGSWRVPADVTLSAELTLNSGPSFGSVIAPWNGLTAPVPQGACCVANFGGVYSPKSTIAYKRLDLRVAKSFKFGGKQEATVSFDAFNVFNWLNRNYSSWGAGGGSPAPLTENSQVGADARAFQVAFKYSF